LYEYEKSIIVFIFYRCGSLCTGTGYC
jgi:hypothetical protein